jgi:hypothetical protein
VSWIPLLLASFATYRIARVISQEDAPFDVMARLRGRVGQRTSFGRGLHCFWCVSFWIAALATAALVLTHHALWVDVWLLWPGIAGVSVAIYQVFR